MTRLALRLAWDVYVLGVVFWAGVAWGDGQRMHRTDWLALWAWPVAGLYGLVWGAHKRRRWFCALAGFLRHGDPYKGHRWRNTGHLPGRWYDAQGRQCRRCWLSEDFWP